MHEIRLPIFSRGVQAVTTRCQNRKANLNKIYQDKLFCVVSGSARPC